MCVTDFAIIFAKSRNPPTFLNPPYSSSLFLVCILLFFYTTVNSHFAQQPGNPIFSEETKISAYTNTFDCQGKSDGKKYAYASFKLLNWSF